MNDRKWWNRSSFKNDFWPISKGEIYVVQELGLQYWDNTPMIYLTYTTENSVSLSWSFSLIWNFSRKMPKQNPFGKIGEDSPPETPTKKGNEPEPERTLLIKHDVCVYRIPPQVTISSSHGIQHRHHHDVMNMNWIFGLRTALTHEGRTAVCFRKNSTPSIVIILCLPACSSSQLSSLSSYFSLQSSSNHIHPI